MFEHTFVEKRRVENSWPLAVSLLGQSLAVAAVVFVPLVFTYKLPASQWVGFLLPAPPVTSAAEKVTGAKPLVKAVPRADHSVLKTPSRIPEKTALVVDQVSQGPSIAFPGSGVRGIAGSIPGGIPGNALGEIAPVFAVPDPPPPSEPAVAESRFGSQPPVQVGGQVQAAKLIRRVAPEYPRLAKQAAVSGVVRLEAIIAKDGTVQKLRVISGHPLLVRATLMAVKQWRYRPTLLNGHSVEVLTHIEVHYSLRR